MNSLDPRISRALKFSNALNQFLAVDPILAENLVVEIDQRLDVDKQWRRVQAMAPADEGADLRMLRRWVWCQCAVRDLNNLATLEEITGAFSHLADLCVEVCLARIEDQLAPRFGRPMKKDGMPASFLVVAMGKLGGLELNVSSDIDLIFLYNGEGRTDGERSLENFEYFQRLAPLLICALSDANQYGPLFRVDMRLRPEGDSGPMVCSEDMLEHYFVTQGRAWERCAWIKARLITGAPSAIAELEKLIRPFVYRKYLDFGALDALRRLHYMIRQKATQKALHDDVKLGPGGIREIEFIVQVFQLIRGGRLPQLRTRSTVPILHELAAAGSISKEAAHALDEAYVFLRRLEHRLQYRDDAQTHLLPQDLVQREALAESMGFESVAQFDEAHKTIRASVLRHFEGVFAEPEESPTYVENLWMADESPEAILDTENTLATLGFHDPKKVGQRLMSFKSSRRYKQLPTESQQRLDDLAPKVIHLIGAATDLPSKDNALIRVLGILEHICHRSTYLALLKEYPQALEHLVRVCGESSWAASFLQRHPLLLDELLDMRFLEGEPDWQGFRQQLDFIMTEHSADVEMQMNQMRELRNAQEFRLLLRDLAGRLTVEHLSDHLSILADHILDATVKLIWPKLNPHRPDHAFAIIAYGKLGGKEMGYMSDLDLTFVYVDDAPESVEKYTRLAQRINSWLSTPTSAGILYLTDLRLRPDGAAGLWAHSLEGLEKYFRTSAWTWELQALTRARFCVGNSQVGEDFERLRRNILCMPRDGEKLKAEVRAMREKVRSAHVVDEFDVKYSPGALMDVEFIVQYLVLAHAAQYPELTRNLGNIALLGMAADFGLISHMEAKQVASHYREFRRLQHRLRLNAENPIDSALLSSSLSEVSQLRQKILG